jgi:apolipoprotein N-acyltransferase
LAWAGFAVLAWRLTGLGWRARLLAGAMAGLGQFGVGLWWVNEFHSVGYVALVLLELAYIAAAAALVPPGQAGLVAFPAAMVLAEWARGATPLGGLPLAGVALGQVASPLWSAARIGGELLLVGVTALVGTAIVAALRLRLVLAAAAVVTAAGLAVVGLAAPGHTAGRRLRVAAVQGGGVRGLRAIYSDPAAVYQRHVTATGRVEPPVDLVLWPEDVVDLDQPLAVSPEKAEIGGLAQGLEATLVAGVVEDAPDERFRNAAVAWAPDGNVVDRYEKVHRVPFGEYIPFRSLIARLADISAVPNDAIAGHGPGLLRTPAGRLGVVISFEVFFPARARAGIRAGGDVLLVPTNASSFKSGQVPAQEVGAARLRAVETGRDVIQAAPTGYAAIIDAAGRVRTRTSLGRQEVLQTAVWTRHGHTPYVRFGDLPVVLAALLLVAGAWVVQRRA